VINEAVEISITPTISALVRRAEFEPANPHREYLEPKLIVTKRMLALPTKARFVEYGNSAGDADCKCDYDGCDYLRR
jgi:hypothetical protein